MGTGITFEVGLNPSANVILWDVESRKIPLNPDKRLYFGPIFQFKNFQRVQIEGGVLYGRTQFRNLNKDQTATQDVTMNEWQVPLNINYNADSPVKFHSAIVYHAGIEISKLIIPSQGMINKRYAFTSPNLSAGVRLASELRSFGRVEYGISYVKNLRERYAFMVENDDAAPSEVNIKQKVGQWQLNLIYYFSPRVYNWSKTRYNLNGLD